MFRRVEYRNKALTDMCRELPCQCQRLACLGGPSVPAHSNQGKHGKGWAIKAHDCFVAAMCNECHFEIDNGRRLSEPKRTELWTDAWRTTMAILSAARRIYLPEIYLDEYVQLTGGGVILREVYPHTGKILLLPGAVPDDVWLDLWKTGRAHTY